MKTTLPTSSCRCCRCYMPEGRRGGQCDQLGVPVQGHWSACTLAMPPFAPTWESVFETPEAWSSKVISLPRSRNLEPVAVGAGDLSPVFATEDVA